MNKLVFISVLVIMSATGPLCAQTMMSLYETNRLLEFPPLVGKERQEYLFYEEDNISHKHSAILENRNVMTVMLWDIKEYKYLGNIDSVLKGLMLDITFYKDSLEKLGVKNVRIDYELSPGSDTRRIRFKVYDTPHEYFSKDGNQVSKIKQTYDTIHVVLKNPIIENEKYYYIGGRTSRQHVYFYLNYYTDLNEIIEKGDLQSIIDTMAAEAAPEGKERWDYSTTIMYYPYIEGEFKFRKYNTSLDFWNPIEHVIAIKYSDKVSFHGNVGAGLVRNKLAPTAEAGFEYRNYWIDGKPNYSVVSAYMAPYFLFDKDAAGKYRTTLSWFGCAEIGSSVEGDRFETLHLQRLTVGAGYLFNPDGVYFQNITIKAFANLTLSKGITISPEVIATDGFKNIFPGITLKVL